MNFIKLAILFGIVSVVGVVMPDESNIWVSNAHQNITRSTRLKGSMPGTYTVKFLFKDENYEHTHTFNKGTYQIHVTVHGSSFFLSSGNLNQVNGDFSCFVDSDALSGRIDIQKTITVLGDKNTSEMQEIMRNNVINIILEEIQKV